jgi:hypothetical protein
LPEGAINEEASVLGLIVNQDGVESK